MSRFATPKSEAARLDALADPNRLGDLDERNPKSLARWMHRMGNEIGEADGHDDLEAMVESIERRDTGDSGNKNES